MKIKLQIIENEDGSWKKIFWSHNGLRLGWIDSTGDFEKVTLKEITEKEFEDSFKISINSRSIKNGYKICKRCICKKD